jgi:Flp pilus assembly protein TadB
MAVATALAIASIAATTAAAVQQRQEARRARREGRREETAQRIEQVAAEKELEQNKQRDDVSRSMFDQRRRQRALASLAGGRWSTNTTGLGLSGGFGTPTKTAIGA